MNKVILIGIDGATPDLIDNWIIQGKLENFRKLKEKGVWGKLKSTTPPFSAPAWASIVTGCNPGKHGIYGFESTGTLEPHLINSKYRKKPAIWNYLSKIEGKTIVVNVPGTYPPEKLNGFMITGLLTPSKDADFTFPTNLKHRLNENDLGKYDLEQFWLEDFSRSRMKKHAPEVLLDKIIKQMNSRLKVTKRLMNEFDWDFTMLVLRGTDTAQHFLFDRQDILLKCYQAVDNLIGNMINTFHEATIFIVSDHGFEKINKIFYPDNLLYNEGFLKPIQDSNENLKSIFNFLFYKFLTKILNILPAKMLKESKKIKKILFSETAKTKLIDFSKTKAFSTADGRGIQICRRNKYNNGIVNEKDYELTITNLTSYLKNVKDEDGRLIVEKIYKANDIYGESAINAPDIIFDLGNNITSSEWIRLPEKTSEMIRNLNKKIPVIYKDDPLGRSGDHSQYGIFYAFGDKIKKNYEITKLKVEDILPNIFLAMGFSPPKEIDGDIKLEIFNKNLNLKKIKWTNEEDDEFGRAKLSKLEFEKVDRLKRELKNKKS